MQDVETRMFLLRKEVRVKQFLRINIENTFFPRYIVSNKTHSKTTDVC